MGIVFITIDNAYMHKTIETAVIILGIKRVKPSALFAKLFAVTPKKTAIAKKKYDVVIFIYFFKFFIFGITILDSNVSITFCSIAKESRPASLYMFSGVS